MKKQMSESLLIGTLLAVSGGLMDAYSYLFRGQVFANAQTGNILLLSVHVTQQEWRLALQYACPVIAFSIGIAWATITRHISKQSGWLHWRQICVLFEAAVLFSVAWFPRSMNLFANSLISLACGTQVEAFRKTESTSVATTMCIGNLRLAIHSTVTHCIKRGDVDKHAALISSAIIAAFSVGAIAGSFLIHRLGTYSIWCSTTILIVCFGLMFFDADY